MAKVFVFFYFMKSEPEKVGPVVSSHIEYWSNLKLENYMGAPFSDRTGALISFSAENMEQAESYIKDDPFVKEDLIDKKWLKEWVVE